VTDRGLKAVICDIDGVLLHDNTGLPGAPAFVARILAQGNPLVLLTNYPSQTERDLQNRLAACGIAVPPEVFYTSAMATADFLAQQDGRKAYVVGEGGLTKALYDVGFTITDIDPDFVVVGETRAYNWDMIRKAAHHIRGGARFIATNPDVVGPGGQPACGAFCAPIERMTGKLPLYMGKPQAWMMRAALNRIHGHAENAVIIGDNMHTDILAGIQSGVETVLVLSGVSRHEDLGGFPYRPHHIFAAVGDVDIV
jgi:NagD protein